MNPKLPKTPLHRSTRGFTLVELLVVIAILVVLVLLSMTGYHRFRASADMATTISVMRQLQLANVGYASDHGGQYVPMESYDDNNARSNEWHHSSVFLAYLTSDSTALQQGRQTVQAPVSILDPSVVRAKARLWDRLFGSYGYVQQGMPAARPSSHRSFRVTEVHQPSRSAAFITASDWKVMHASRFNWLNERDPMSQGKTTDQRMAYRHKDKAIVVYYDGSTGLVSPDDIRAIDAQGGANHPFWKANAR